MFSVQLNPVFETKLICLWLSGYQGLTLMFSVVFSVQCPNPDSNAQSQSLSTLGFWLSVVFGGKKGKRAVPKRTRKTRISLQ